MALGNSPVAVKSIIAFAVAIGDGKNHGEVTMEIPVQINSVKTNMTA